MLPIRVVPALQPVCSAAAAPSRGSTGGREGTGAPVRFVSAWFSCHPPMRSGAPFSLISPAPALPAAAIGEARFVHRRCPYNARGEINLKPGL